MNIISFCKRYVGVLLIILTQKCAIAYVNNVTLEQANLAKVLLSYLKVPWIDLDSSWRDKVASTCRNDIVMLFESADAGEMWALQMLDSASKIPSGILTGNIRDLGMYDECIRVKAPENRGNIGGRHCMVSLSMPSKFVEDASAILFVQKLSIYNPTSGVDLSFSASLCLPKSCGIDDVVGFVNASIQNTPELLAFEVNVADATCSNIDITDDLVLGRLLAASFFAVVAAFLLFCTVCDFVIRARCDDSSLFLKTAAQFSLYTNTIKLVSTQTSPDTMSAIHGIRFLNTCLIVIGHRALSVLVKPSINLLKIYESRQTFLGDFLHMLPYVVDAFFMLSGFLTASIFLRDLQAGKKCNILVVYLHRYLRLTPCLAVVLLIHIFFLPNIGSGPLWETVIDATNGFCRKNWWANLLYVQNLVNNQEMCMIHTWYLATEMQLFWLSPIILYPLFYHPKLGLTMLGLLSIVFFIVPAVPLGLYEWSAVMNYERSSEEMYRQFFSFYTMTYNRVLPYLLGVYIGYDVVNKKRCVTKAQMICNWILAGIFVLFSCGVTHFIQPNAVVYSAVWEIIYMTFARFAWSIAIAWVFYAITQGYGGYITKFLSLPVFVPLSRLCYGIYLVHFVLQVHSNATIKTAEHIGLFNMIYLISGDLVLSAGIAFILTLSFETPVIVLERLLRSKQVSAVTKHDYPERKKELAAMIKEYLDQTRRPVNSPLATERIVSRSDLPQTISGVLKTSLNEELTEIAAEWVEAWQDWKSCLLSIDCQQNSGMKPVQSGVLKSQNEKTTLEKELFIFLAGLSCGLNEGQGSEKSNVMGLRSQLESSNWKNENLGRPSNLNSTSFDEKRN